MSMTITESLQEIQTIRKRLEKKRTNVAQYLGRDARLRDPFEKDGGSAKYIAEERQAITDLEKRVVAIRTAIQNSNLKSKLAINGTTQTVAEWLTWRREVAADQQTFVRQLVNGIASARAQVQQKGGRVVAAAVAVNEGTTNDLPQVIVNVDEKALLDEQEALETTLGVLDGKLSLFNATTVIEF